MSQPEASADLASLQAEPDGALHLTPEQRAAMAVMRGVHVPPFELSLSRFGGKNTPASAQPLVDAVSEILRPRDADTPATRATSAMVARGGGRGTEGDGGVMAEQMVKPV